LPSGDLVDRLRRFCFHLLRYPNYGALTFTPAGLSPAEHARLTWTHLRTQNPKQTKTRLDKKSPIQVRIRLPPAGSQVRTCLWREFTFLRREAAVFHGCAGRGEWRGRERRVGRDNIGPTSGNISVGRYSSTVRPMMLAA